MAIAGDVMIRFSGDFAELKAGLATLQQNMVGFGDNIKSLGTKVEGAIGGLLEKLVAFFAVEKVLAYADAIAELADRLEDTASNLKLTVEQFEALEGAAFLAGQSTDAVQKALEKFNIFLGNVSRGGKEQIEVLRELGINTRDANGKDRDRIAILTEVSQKLVTMEDATKRSSYEVNIFGKSGQAVSAITEQWAKGIDAVNAELSKQGLLLDKEAREKMAAAKDEAEKLHRQNQVLFSAIYSPSENWGLKVLNEILKSISESLKIIKSDVGVFDRLNALANLGTFGAYDALNKATGGADNIQKFTEKLKEFGEASTEAQKRYKTLIDQGFAEGSPPVQRAKKDILDATVSMSNYQNLINQLTPKMPPVTIVGKPDPGGAGGSLPGVKGEGDSFLEAIKKLEGEKKAAQDAINNLVNSDTSLSLKQINTQVELDKKIAEAIAGFAAKDKASPYLAQISALIKETYTLQAALKETQRIYDAAEADQKRYGDGTRELKDKLKDLSLELKTGRLTQDAYAAAVKDATDVQKNQADVVARAKGGFDAYEAGIANAARAFEKANDSFSLGQQTFSAFTSAMGEGLDALAGKSSKTFSQIATDFALMLAKMAAQAAVSTIFKQIFNFAVTALGGGPGEAYGPPAPASLGGNRAAGGGVFADTSYVVGEHGPEVFTPTAAGSITPVPRATPDVTNNYAELNKTFSNVTNAINDIKTFNENVSSAVHNDGSSSFATADNRTTVEGDVSSISDVRSVIRNLTSRMTSSFNAFASSVGGDAINSLIGGDSEVSSLIESSRTSSINDMRSTISNLVSKVASTVNASSSTMGGNSLTNRSLIASTVNAPSSVVEESQSTISNLVSKVASSVTDGRQFTSAPSPEGAAMTSSISSMVSKVASTINAPSSVTNAPQSSAIVNAISSFFSMMGGNKTISNVMPTSPSKMILDLLGVRTFGGQRAMGGSVDPMAAYAVGENGPELFTPTVAGNVQPMKVKTSDPNVAVSIDMTKSQGSNNPSQALEFGRKVKQAVLDIIQNEQRPGGTLYSGSR